MSTSTTTTTTSDQTLASHGNRPTEHTGADHPSHPADAPSPIKQRRTALRWFGGGAVAVAAAAAASVLVIAADTDTSVNDVVPLERSGAVVVTELDVRGVPTWWSRQGGATRPADATELDVHGIPISWSGNASAP